MENDWLHKTAKVQQFLRDFFGQHRVDETTGSVLHDTQTVLDYIADGLFVSLQKQELNQADLAKINAKMRHPLHLGLKRPQQTSYPPIMVLYQLLQKLGFFEFDHSKDLKKVWLNLNQTVLNSWRQLNATERYFTLLYTGVFCLEEPLLDLSSIFNLLTQLNDPDKRECKTYSHFKADLNPYKNSLALLELFGWLKLDYGLSTTSQHWWVKQIHLTEWPLAMALLIGREDKANSHGIEIETAMLEDDDIELFRQQIVDYIPQWQKHLALPKIEILTSGVHVFKVAWADNPEIWRRLTVPTQATWEELAQAILTAFQFDDGHLYEFRYPSHFGGYQQIFHPFLEEAQNADEIRIGDLGLTQGCQLVFLYDYGDTWLFTLLLEQIEDKNIKQIQTLAQQGDAPKQYD